MFHPTQGIARRINYAGEWVDETAQKFHISFLDDLVCIHDVHEYAPAQCNRDFVRELPALSGVWPRWVRTLAAVWPRWAYGGSEPWRPFCAVCTRHVQYQVPALRMPSVFFLERLVRRRAMGVVGIGAAAKLWAGSPRGTRMVRCCLHC